MRTDKKRLHDLFMTGMLIAEIALELGITYDSCQTIISNERKKDPFSWPLRKSKSVETSSKSDLYMHLYECTGEDCFVTFGVEDYEGIDQSAIVCPHCHTDQFLEDKGYGFFVITIPAKEEAG